MELSWVQERIFSFLSEDDGRLERVSRIFRETQLMRRSKIEPTFSEDRITLTSIELMEKYWRYRDLYHILLIKNSCS
jgi:hypothetical protein